MTLWDVMLKEQEERENNKTKEFHRNALKQQIDEEISLNPSNKPNGHKAHFGVFWVLRE